jgi:hypothetical protein
MPQARAIPDHDAVIAMFEEQARKEDAYFRLIADKIEADPSLLSIPLENIGRWMDNGHWAVTRLNQWKDLIETAQKTGKGMRRLLLVLRSDDEEMRFFKGFAPFPGVVSREEAACLP